MRIASRITLSAFTLVPILFAQSTHVGGPVITVGSGFNHPYGVTVDGKGNIFVADACNSEVKEIVAVRGSVSRSSNVKIVGSGFNCPRGVAVDRNGNVFVADWGNDAVKEILAANGVVSKSVFHKWFRSIVAFSNRLFTGHEKVHETLSSISQVIVVGSGFHHPSGVAVDSSGNVYVADTFNGALKKIVADRGLVSSSSKVVTLSSDYNDPASVVLDNRGNLFFSDIVDDVFVVKEIVGSGPISETSEVKIVSRGFKSLYGIAVDRCGNVFVTEDGNGTVSEIVAGTGGAAIGTVSSSSTVEEVGRNFLTPLSVVVDSKGNLFVAEMRGNAVKEIVVGGF